MKSKKCTFHFDHIFRPILSSSRFICHHISMQISFCVRSVVKRQNALSSRELKCRPFRSIFISANCVIRPSTRQKSFVDFRIVFCLLFFTAFLPNHADRFMCVRVERSSEQCEMNHCRCACWVFANRREIFLDRREMSLSPLAQIPVCLVVCVHIIVVYAWRVNGIWRFMDGNQAKMT